MLFMEDNLQHFGPQEQAGEDMDFNQINYFLSILRTGSFSEAAAASFISQSSISKQIQALENELGVKLFRREHSKVSLSEAGYEFFSFAEDCEKRRMELDARLRQYSDKNQDTLSIGSIPVMVSDGIASMFAKFQKEMLQENLNVNFDIYSEEQDVVFNALKTNKIDLAFLRPTYLSKDLYESFLVTKDEIVFVCHKDNLLSTRKEISLEQLSQERIILISPRSSLYQTCFAELMRFGVSGNVVSTTGRHPVALEMVNHNLGVTLLPRRLLVEDTRYSGLVSIPLTEPIQVYLSLMKQKKRELPYIAQRFWDFVKEQYSCLP